MQILKENLVYILLVIACLGLGFYMTMPEFSKLYTRITTNIEKTKQNKDMMAQLDQARLEAEQKKIKPRAAAKQIYQADNYMLGAEASFAPLFETVIEKAKHSNIKIKSIDYNYAPKGDPIYESKTQGFNSCELSMYVVGTYEQFQQFVKDLVKESYLVNLAQIQATPYEHNQRILLIDLKLRLYTKS